MKKAGNILLIISGVFAIISAVGCLIGGIVMLVMSGPSFFDKIVALVESGEIHSSHQGTPEEIAAFIQFVFMVCGIVCMTEVGFCSACGVVAFLGKKKETEGLYIANIILGVLSGSIFAIVGGVLGIVGKNE